jgi:hypothetical protein
MNKKGADAYSIEYSRCWFSFSQPSHNVLFFHLLSHSERHSALQPFNEPLMSQRNNQHIRHR